MAYNKCVIGVTIDFDTNQIIKVYEGEYTELDVEFGYCPDCGKKND